MSVHQEESIHSINLNWPNTIPDFGRPAKPAVVLAGPGPEGRHQDPEAEGKTELTLLLQ